MSEAPAADPLRLECCPGCGYSLKGLPADGVCPECGGPYDSQNIVLHGWARGSHANMQNAPPWVAVGLGIFPAIYVLGQLVQYRTKGSALHLGLALLWLFGMGWIVWRRWNTPLPGLVQVHLRPEGCAQIDASLGKPPVVLVPWADVPELTLEEISLGRVRVRIGRPTQWWRPRTTRHDVVDAEVNCTREQSAALRARVGHWRRQGAAAIRATGSEAAGAPAA